MPMPVDPCLSLTPQRAFVVQFSADTTVEAGRMAGRVEHIVSRQATTFHTLEALLTFCARVLQAGLDGSAEPGTEAVSAPGQAGAPEARRLDAAPAGAACP
jgi:hypothetical protein